MFLLASTIITAALAWWTYTLTYPASTIFELDLRLIGGVNFDESGETEQFLSSPRHVETKDGSLHLTDSDFEVYAIFSPGGYSEGGGFDPETLEAAISLGHGATDTFIPTVVPGRLAEDSTVLRSEGQGHQLEIIAFGESEMEMATARREQQSSILSAPGPAYYSLLVMDSPNETSPYQSLALSRDAGDSTLEQLDLPEYFIYAKGDLEVRVDGTWLDPPAIGGAPGRGVVIVGAGGDLEAISKEIKLQPAPSLPLDENPLPVGDILAGDNVTSIRLSDSLGTLRVSGRDDEELQDAEILEIRDIEPTDGELAGLPPSVQTPARPPGRMLIAVLFSGITDATSDPENFDLRLVGKSDSIDLNGRNLAVSEWDQDKITRWARPAAFMVALGLLGRSIRLVTNSVTSLGSETVITEPATHTPPKKRRTTSKTKSRGRKKTD